MVSAKLNKLDTALARLDEAIKLYESNKEMSESLRFYALAKAFEVAMEYAWKSLKAKAEDAGFEVSSPKEALRLAAKIKLIDDPERWIEYLHARNMGVHDYFGISEADYAAIAKEFCRVAKKTF